MREDEFTELAAGYQAELRAHCYRILGSVHDAEDALQEALVRAWKGIDRAVLLLREVAGFSAAEIAGLLGTTAASVTSALQRARVTIAARAPGPSQQSALRTLGDTRVRELVGQYADAMEQGDINALVGLLTRDVSWSMPPVPTWYQGLDRVTDFLVRYPLTDRWRHRPTGANGQPAVAGYLWDADLARFIPASIDVLTLTPDGKIAAVTGFLTADLIGAENAGRWITGAELFARFGLPADPP